jgi:hypothetical protein
MEEIRALRLQGKNHAAWELYQQVEEKDTADCAYERSILSYYVGVTKEEALLDFMRSYSRYKNIDYSNLLFYVLPFPSTVHPFPLTEPTDFLPTSTSILPLDDRILINVRYVNYRIQENGSYLMSEGGTLHPHAHLRTRNFFLFTDRSFSTFSSAEEIVPSIPPLHDRHIHGIEDIRLFRKGSVLHFSGTTCEYSHNGLIQEIQGVYDIRQKLLTNLSPMHSPHGHHVEKNWIPMNRAYEDESRFIYSWHPLTIGRVTDGHFHVEQTIETPYFFKHVRGSTTLVSYENFLYTMVHCVIESCPRKYYHLLVKLDSSFVVAYTVPYYFVKNHIEYTLGMYIADSVITCIASQNDCNPIIVKIPMERLLWISC